MSIIAEISQAIQNGKMKLIKELVPQAIEQGHTAQDILNNGLLLPQRQRGRHPAVRHHDR